MGSQHFIVNRAYGRIEGMLPTVELAQKLPPLTLHMLPDGYAGGGYQPVDDTFFREEWQAGFEHFDGKRITRLAWDLAERWTLDLRPYGRWAEYSISALADGDLLLTGDKGDGEGNYLGPIILRVDGAAGTVRWHYEDLTPPQDGRMRFCCEREDGTLVFLHGMHAQAAEGMALVGLSAGGDLLYERPILGEKGESAWRISRLLPLGEGYVACATKGADANDWALLRIDPFGQILSVAALKPPEGTDVVMLPFLSGSPSGEHLYLHGSLCAPDDTPHDPKGNVQLFYLRVTEALFP